MKTLEAYGCDNCSMISRRKGSVTRHEARHCKKSPIRVACILCKNSSFEDYDYTTGDGGWDCSARGQIIAHTMNDNIICSDFDRATNNT